MSFTARACGKDHHCSLCGKPDAEYQVRSLSATPDSRYVCVVCYRATVDDSDSDSSNIRSRSQHRQPQDRDRIYSLFDRVGREPTESQLDDWENVERGVAEAMQGLRIEQTHNNGRDSYSPSWWADSQPKVEDEQVPSWSASTGATSPAWPDASRITNPIRRRVPEHLKSTLPVWPDSLGVATPAWPDTSRTTTEPVWRPAHVPASQVHNSRHTVTPNCCNCRPLNQRSAASQGCECNKGQAASNEVNPQGVYVSGQPVILQQTPIIPIAIQPVQAIPPNDAVPAQPVQRSGRPGRNTTSAKKPQEPVQILSGVADYETPCDTAHRLQHRPESLQPARAYETHDETNRRRQPSPYHMASPDVTEARTDTRRGPHKRRHSEGAIRFCDYIKEHSAAPFVGTDDLYASETPRQFRDGERRSFTRLRDERHFERHDPLNPGRQDFGRRQRQHRVPQPSVPPPWDHLSIWPWREDLNGEYKDNDFKDDLRVPSKRPWINPPRGYSRLSDGEIVSLWRRYMPRVAELSHRGYSGPLRLVEAGQPLAGIGYRVVRFRPGPSGKLEKVRLGTCQRRRNCQ